MLVTTLFAVELALLFVHEMDAIRHREWQMFAILKDMPEEKAYRTFLLLHIPLYAVVLVLLFSSWARIGFYVVDIFLAAHLLLHLGFRRHPANQLTGGLSQAFIYAAGALASLHLVAISVPAAIL